MNAKCLVKFIYKMTFNMVAHAKVISMVGMAE